MLINITEKEYNLIIKSCDKLEDILVKTTNEDHKKSIDSTILLLSELLAKCDE